MSVRYYFLNLLRDYESENESYTKEDKFLITVFSRYKATMLIS